MLSPWFFSSFVNYLIFQNTNPVFSYIAIKMNTLPSVRAAPTWCVPCILTKTKTNSSVPATTDILTPRTARWYLAPRDGHCHNILFQQEIHVLKQPFHCDFKTFAVSFKSHLAPPWHLGLFPCCWNHIKMKRSCVTRRLDLQDYSGTDQNAVINYNLGWAGDLHEYRPY